MAQILPYTAPPPKLLLAKPMPARLPFEEVWAVFGQQVSRPLKLKSSPAHKRVAELKRSADDKRAVHQHSKPATAVDEPAKAVEPAKSQPVMVVVVAKPEPSKAAVRAKLAISARIDVQSSVPIEDAVVLQSEIAPAIAAKCDATKPLNVQVADEDEEERADPQRSQTAAAAPVPVPELILTAGAKAKKDERGAAQAQTEVAQAQQLQQQPPVMCQTRWRKAWTEEFCVNCGRDQAFIPRAMRVCSNPPKARAGRA